jgi:hypothetical protein
MRMHLRYLFAAALLGACTPSADDIAVEFQPEEVILVPADYRSRPAVGNFGIKNTSERDVYVTPLRFEGDFADLLTTRDDNDIRIRPDEIVWLPITYQPTASLWQHGSFEAQLFLEIGMFSGELSGPAEAARVRSPSSWVSSEFPMSVRFTWNCDIDEDGFIADSCGGTDCHDQNSRISPDSPEVCDAADNDCNGLRDDNAQNATTWYRDGDNDSFGTEDEILVACERPSSRWTTVAGDCDDTEPRARPIGTEFCGDGIDNDCANGPEDGCEVVDTVVIPVETADTGTTDTFITDTTDTGSGGNGNDSGWGDTFNTDTGPSGPPPDTDGDGITDADEAIFGTDPFDPDTDDDGLRDLDELVTYGTDPRLADTDGDGLQDADEVLFYGTSPSDPDSDDDGLDDRSEIVVTDTDPLDDDSDGDQLLDGEEFLTYDTDPNLLDTDGDALSDGVEVMTYGTDPNVEDTDGDGLDDYQEGSFLAFDPLDPDMDDDGLTDGEEYNTWETDPITADSDGDGLDDFAEVITHLTDPWDPDTDDDTLSDGDEILVHGTDPFDIDPDGDTVPDPDEITFGTDPFDADTDGDGSSDAEEIYINATNPTRADPDRDGLRDPREIAAGTDPFDPDSDDDGWNDGTENNAGTDPLDPNDMPQSGTPIDTSIADTGDTGDTDGTLPGVRHRFTAIVDSVFEDGTNPDQFFPGVTVGTVITGTYRYDPAQVLSVNSSNSTEARYEFDHATGADYSIDLATPAGAAVILESAELNPVGISMEITVVDDGAHLGGSRDYWKVLALESRYENPLSPSLTDVTVSMNFELQTVMNFGAITSTDLPAGGVPDLSRFESRQALTINGTSLAPLDNATLRATVLTLEEVVAP